MVGGGGGGGEVGRGGGGGGGGEDGFERLSAALKLAFKCHQFAGGFTPEVEAHFAALSERMLALAAARVAARAAAEKATVEAISV